MSTREKTSTSIHLFDLEAEDACREKHHRSCPDDAEDTGDEASRPASRQALEARAQHQQGKTFAEVEEEIHTAYEQLTGADRLPWRQAELPAQDSRERPRSDPSSHA
jgi:hypothetical protein